MSPLLDLRGTRDTRGYELHATVVAVADELASAAELVTGQARGVPAALVRGCRFPRSPARRGSWSCPPSAISSPDENLTATGIPATIL
jgi:coenzyme F420-0:L-glutamate ligase/coenzyme F420-1:gamma-L-glutamate ligase